MNKPVQRRDFIRHSLATGAGVTLSHHALARTVGANDRVRLGFIGLGRQGRGLLKTFIRNKEVEVAALCDVYAPQLKQAMNEAKIEAPVFSDFRRLLDDKNIDAVVIATPDHWHALNAVMACQAGKDVYVEKPISVTVDEGRKMVQAARKYNRVVQVGTMQRSGRHYQAAAEIIRSGQLGTISFVRTWNYGNSAPEGIGSPPDSMIPDELDWEMWLGPAPKVPFNANRFGVHPDRWSSFRWFWDYAGGMMTDWGVHHLDIVQMLMNVDAPRAVTGLGGKYALRDNRETPDTLLVSYEYPGFVCTYENRECNARGLNGQGYGISFHGTEGTLYINREGFEITPEMRRAGDKSEPRTTARSEKSSNSMLDDHVRNFLDCLRSRRNPVCEIETGHRSTTTALLGNIAFRSGRRINWNAKTEQIENDKAAAQYLTREYRKPWKLTV